MNIPDRLALKIIREFMADETNDGTAYARDLITHDDAARLDEPAIVDPL